MYWSMDILTNAPFTKKMVYSSLILAPLQVLFQQSQRMFELPDTFVHNLKPSRDTEASFALLDVKSDTIVIYTYHLNNGNVRVDRRVFKKSQRTAAGDS